MGTTKTALTSQKGVRVQLVLAIEGYDYLLTDGDTAAAVTAWSGTDWTQALGGLFVDGQFDQSLTPWASTFGEGGSFRFRVVPDSADTFGTTVHAIAAGAETDVTEDVDMSETSISVKDAAQMTAATAYGYIGCETIKYTGRDTGLDVLTGCTRGYYSPFAVDGGTRFSRPHMLADVAKGVTLPTKITTAPRQWVGRWVGLWMHRVLGDTLDVKAQAQLVFAGRIADVADTSDGSTVVECEHVLSTLDNAIIFADQFRGELKPDLFVPAGAEFKVREYGGTLGVGNWSDPLTVVSSGASGTDQMNEGFYTASDLLSIIGEWLANDGNLTKNWVAYIDDGGLVTVGYQNASGSNNYVSLFGKGFILRDLGYSVPESQWNKDDLEVRNGPVNGAEFIAVVADEEVARINGPASSRRGISLLNSAGTWFNNYSYLPERLKNYCGSAGNWGVLDIGGALYLAKYSSDTEFTDLHPLNEFGEPLEAGESTKVTTTEVRQVICLGGKWQDIFARLLASTGTSGYNHATYDAYTYGLGAAIPWSLLGDNFVNSLQQLDEGVVGGTTMLIDEPTKLSDLVGADMILRNAHLVWKDQGLRLVAWSTPTEALSVHTLTESNKASAVPGDDQRTPTTTTNQYMRNVVRFEFMRDFAGKYWASREFRYERSINDHGERAVTVKLRNASREEAEQLMASFVGNVLPVYGAPLNTFKRTISFNLFEGMSPGDLAQISDDFVRDPTTGARGISGKPCMVMAHSFSWGGDGADMVGEVELAWRPFDRTASYCPTAEVDETANTGGFTAGYDSTNFILRCKAHAHSLSSESADASNFAAGDKILIAEINPASGSADSWTRTIDSVSGNDITLTSALSSPSFSSSKLYRVTSQSYASAVSTQQTKSYQADDADLQIQDLRAPYEYGRFADSTAVSEDDPSTAPERHASVQYGDGAAVASAYHKALAQGANWLIAYGTAPMSPNLWAARAASGITSGYQTIAILPLYIGGNNTTPPGKVRKLYLRPLASSSSAGLSATVRATITLTPPVHVDNLNNAAFDASSRSASWTTTATAYKLLGNDTDTITLLRTPEPVIWLTIEVNRYGRCQGFPRFFVGPLEDA